MIRCVYVVTIAMLAVANRAAGQDPRLERLDVAIRLEVARIIDSTRAIQLPTEPLIQRALEGGMKGASGERIIAAVRRLAADLGTVRATLGDRTSAPELEAGVAALRAGASNAVLARLRDARRPPRSIAFAVLADLVASGVPPDSAAAAVIALAPRARDAELVDFRRAVERDIALGAPPAAATSVRLDATARIARPGRP